MKSSLMYDVAIIGGGPSGSTLATLLKKYKPELKVLILEREKFPREHVGESQLPPIGAVLNEMGVWDKVEAANFPIKIGATYRWGNTRDLWDFELYPADKFRDEPRPAKFEGQRTSTAFQVERSVYDKILLDHAKSVGVEVREETKVTQILNENDHILGIEIESGETIVAKHYVDASGSSGFMRRALNIPIVEPSSLRNIAFWDYWNNTEWAFSVGTGGTRVQVMSLGYGWIWFIPIGPTRTSIGLVCPAEYYRQTGLTKEEVYERALKDEPLINGLIKNATRDNKVQATKDWSYYAQRMHGKNWFLVGEAAGFADPILAAGLTMAHIAAKELAYTILAIENGDHDPEWLRNQMSENQTRRVEQHIKFADFWYTANGCFTDIKEFTREIASDAGLQLDANSAFQWLGTGGFIHEHTYTGLAGYTLEGVKDTVEILLQESPDLEISKYNFFQLNLDGAIEENFAIYQDGKIYAQKRWRKNGQTLPQMGMYFILVQILRHNGTVQFVLDNITRAVMQKGIAKTQKQALDYGLAFLEALVHSGWVIGSSRHDLPKLKHELPKWKNGIHLNVDTFVTKGSQN
ncbi:MAG: NAD(P)/FAD-dependent oxidoreductase [Fimbriimonadaceae bacterium]